MALLVDFDTDGDGALDHLDDEFPNNSIRSIACKAGQYGRYVCVDAPLGKYVSSSSAVYATDCLAGTYQATTGQSSCDTADAGHYVDSALGTSQPTQTPCLAGTYNPISSSTNSSACENADAGYYVASIGQSNQTACSAGTYQVNIMQDSCDDADAGYYVPSTGQSSQTICPVGAFQVNTGEDSCDDANTGYYVNETGQSIQIECSLGTYQADTGQFACDLANVGYYVNQTAQSSQIQCPSGYSTISLGSTVSLQCVSDSDSDGQVDILDLDDDDDGVSDVTDQCFTADFNLSMDIDNDGCDDSDEDLDDDNDGVLDTDDAFPLDSTEWADVNKDGLGDNKNSPSKSDNSKQTLILALVGMILVLGLVFQLYRAKVASKEEERTIAENTSEEE